VAAHLPWPEVRAAAEAGARAGEIARAFGLHALLREHSANCEFRRIVAEGNARWQLELRARLRKRAFGSRGVNSSPTLLTALARADLSGFAAGPAPADSGDAFLEQIAGAEGRLGTLLDKLAKNRRAVNAYVPTPRTIPEPRVESPEKPAEPTDAPAPEEPLVAAPAPAAVAPITYPVPMITSRRR
jgi:hypothetical protein